jgi:hypothetical protein
MLPSQQLPREKEWMVSRVARKGERGVKKQAQAREMDEAAHKSNDPIGTSASHAAPPH